jgi:hypothetical protein
MVLLAAQGLPNADPQLEAKSATLLPTRRPAAYTSIPGARPVSTQAFNAAEGGRDRMDRHLVAVSLGQSMPRRLSRRLAEGAAITMQSP